MTGDPTHVLAAAAIPRERWGNKRLSSLTEYERRLYRFVLMSFRDGTVPGRDELAEAASELGLQLEPALARLADADLVHADERGAILVAYPFSGRPTAHRIRFDGHQAYAMCAIDALGIAPMLGEPIEISSRDPLSGDEIRARVAPDGSLEWSPESAVVAAGAIRSQGDASGGCCPVLNFFASAANAQRWLAEHPEVRGTSISIPEAAAAGRVLFGDVLADG